MLTAAFNAHMLSYDSYLLNHSRAYQIAAVASWTEYGIRQLVVVYPPVQKLAMVGVATCVLGDELRKLAMYTAGANFTHIVAFNKADGHELVTGGVYRIARHPAYMGWFWWSIGSQVVLNNPLCAIAYTAAAWRFFSERIVSEEAALLYFFGDQYEQYQKEVGSGVPFIKGCLLTDAEHESNRRRRRHLGLEPDEEPAAVYE